MAENHPLRIVILGATSAIAAATARLYASDDKASLLLVGRNERRLSEMAADLTARGASRVETAACDLAMPSAAQQQFDHFAARLGGVDHVLIAYGLLGEQPLAERS